MIDEHTGALPYPPPVVLVCTDVEGAADLEDTIETEFHPALRLLSVGSCRVVDLRTSMTSRTSGVREPVASEAQGTERRFERLVPWPPVPGLPLTIVWPRRQAEKLMRTRTSMLLAAWPERDVQPNWTSHDKSVRHNGRTVLDALTAEAAHGIAVAAASSTSAPSQLSAVNTQPFAARGTALLAGTDLVGSGRTDDVAAALATRLCNHPAAALLAAGIAVAADPTIGGYRLDPTWQMQDGPEPWCARVEAAALRVGASIVAEGALDAGQWHGVYRHVPCGARWDGQRLQLDFDGARIEFDNDAAAGPLRALSLLMDAIDQIDPNELMEYALAAPWTPLAYRQPSGQG